jgi:hypothetical protein
MGVAVLLASGLGYLAMLAWVILLGGHHRKFMFAMTTVVPVATLIVGPLGFMLLYRWLRLELARFLLVGLAAGAWIYWLRGNQWNWHPAFAGDLKTALLLIGFPAVGAGVFCAMLKRFAPDLAEP